ncbi:MAG: nitrilase-related carbon-nitrogen hydrolase [Candidatus Zixiibacteriota bacterium]
MFAPKGAKMKVGYIQFEPVLGDVAHNIGTLDTMIAQADGAELLVLPELCSTGYRFESRQQAWDLSETTKKSRFVRFLTSVCAKRATHIVAGFDEREGDKLYNTAVLVGPNGLIGKYRKLHLFMDEKDIFEPGNFGLPVFNIGPCTIGMVICFDWQFPEVWRVLALKGADIICHPSNLVLPGLCQKALPVHAVCNRVFVITANRIGTERDLTFTGLSTIADPKSNVLVQASPDRAEVGLVDIDIALARNKRPTPKNHVFDDRRPDEYRLLVES